LANTPPFFFLCYNKMVTSKSPWILALKKWNSEKNPNTYCIPRKGTREHATVLRMVDKSKNRLSPLEKLVSPTIARRLNIKITSSLTKKQLLKRKKQRTIAKKVRSIIKQQFPGIK